MADRASIRGEMVGKGARGHGFLPPPPTNQTTNIFLIATVHGDPQGYGRAWRLFERVRPDMITVEISRFSVRYRKRAARGWRRRLAEALRELPAGAAGHLAIARVAAQAELPFEYRAARDWGRAHEVPVKLLDGGGLARRHLPRYATELFSRENLGLLLQTGASGTLEDFIVAEFRWARRALDGQMRRLFPTISGETGRRERLWARRLRRLVAGGKRLVHLGGWEHLVAWPEGGGLNNLLADLRPCVLLLDEAEDLGGPGVADFYTPPSNHLGIGRGH